MIETIAPLPLEQPVEGPVQHGQLPLAADERRLRVRRRAGADRRHSEGSGRIADLDELEQPVDLVRRRRPHDDLAERLQALGRVGRAAEPLVHRNHDRARVDGHARAKVEPGRRCDLGGVGVDRLPDRERSADGALGVALVRDLRAEEREDAVVAQPGDGAAEALHLLPHQPHDLVEEERRALGAELLGDRRSSHRRRRRER